MGGPATVSNISGSGSLRQAGSGSLLLTGNNGYTGGTTISAGTLTAAWSGGAGFAALGGNILNNSALVLTRTTSDTQFLGVITGSGATTINGNGGYLTLGAPGELSPQGDLTVNIGLNLMGNSQTIGALSGSGSITSASGLSRAVTLTLGNDNASGAFSGGIQDFNDALSLVKAGLGLQVLSGSNSYSGTTTVSGGTLQIGAGGNATLGGGNIANNGVLAFNGGNALSVAGAISGSGGLFQVGGGTLTLTSAASSYTGNLTIVQGTVIAQGSIGGNAPTTGSLGNSQLAHTITVNAGATLRMTTSDILGNDGSPDAVTVAVSQGGLVTNAGGAFDRIDQLTLSGGTLRGVGGPYAAYPSFQLLNVAVNGSVESFISQAALGNADYANANGQMNLARGGTTVFNVANNTGAVDLLVTAHLQNGVNGSALQKTGPGMMVLAASDSYSNGTTVSAGTLQLGNMLALGTGGVVVNGGLLDVNGNAISVPSLSGSGGTITDQRSATATAFTVNQAGNTTFSGTIQNGAAGAVLSLTKSGAGLLNLSGGNYYSGGTFIDAGTLSLGNFGALPSSGNIAFGGGTLQFTAGNTLDYSGSIVNSTGAVSIDTNSQSVTFASPLSSSNSGGLTKIGAGTLTLSASNTYTGGTTVSAGVLTIGSTGTLGATSGSLTVNGGTLDLGTTSQDVAAVTISGGTIQDGTLTGTSYTATNASAALVSASLAGGSSLVKSGNGTLVLSGSNSYAGGTSVNVGTLQLTNPSALGGTTVGTNVAAGATLDLNGQTLTAYTISGLAGSGVGGNGALVNSNTATAATFAGPLTLTGATSIGGAGNLTISGTIGDNGPGFSLTKVSAGTLTLSGSNTYGGTTTLTSGLLVVANVQALGANSTAAALTLNGGTLDLATDSSINPYNTTVGGNVTILSDKATAASAGITQTLGALLDRHRHVDRGPRGERQRRQPGRGLRGRDPRGQRDLQPSDRRVAQRRQYQRRP